MSSVYRENVHKEDSVVTAEAVDTEDLLVRGHRYGNREETLDTIANWFRRVARTLLATACGIVGYLILRAAFGEAPPGAAIKVWVRFYALSWVLFSIVSYVVRVAARWNGITANRLRKTRNDANEAARKAAWEAAAKHKAQKTAESIALHNPAPASTTRSQDDWSDAERAASLRLAERRKAAQISTPTPAPEPTEDR